MKLITLIENFLKIAFYPAFYEELLFRGVLISGLLYFKIDHWKINIVQALIFGITHFSANTQIGSNYIMVLSLCSSQFLSGYFWGEIYFKTNSLFTCIIFHTLMNTFYGTLG